MNTSPETDRELAESARAGSLEAFEELVRRYEGRIYRFALRICGRPEDAQDITQDAFVRAFRRLDRYDADREFAPWLFTIARRRAIDHLRSGSTEVREAPPELADPEDPASLLVSREQNGGVWASAQKALTETQFQALWLRYAEDLDTAQVASVLGISGTHAKVLLWRARAVLARKLKSRVAAEEGPSTGLAANLHGQSSRPELRFVAKGLL